MMWSPEIEHLSVKIAKNEGFEYFQLKDWLLLHHLAKENKIKPLQLRLLFFDNNLFENNSEKVIEPTKPDKNLDFVYP